MRQIWVPILLSGLMLAPAVARADAVFTASGTALDTGDPISASADFSLVGGNLQIVLTNTSVGNSGYQPGDGLTGLFFSMPGAPALTPVSALLTAGSSILHPADCTINPCGSGVTNVGGEFNYQNAAGGFSGFPLAPGSANEGVSSAGYGPFGIANMNGPNLAPPPSGAVDGIQFALVGTDFNQATANSAMQTNALIENSVTLTFSNLPANFQLSSIGNVAFGYGTTPETVLLGHGGQGNIPEPASLLLLATGLLGLGALGRFRGNRNGA